MRKLRPLGVILTALSLIASLVLAACGARPTSALKEEGEIKTVVFNADRTRCNFRVQTKFSKPHLTRQYDNDVCRAGTAVKYWLAKDGSIEVEYDVAYTIVAKTPGANGECTIGLEPDDKGWPPRTFKQNRQQCTRFTAGGKYHERHKAPQEGQKIA